jgi:hypothetical protein
MAIIFNNGATLGESAGRINVPGRIVQTVHTVFTTAVSTSSLSAANLFTSNAITLSKANSIVLIEFHCDVRLDSRGDGQWNLYYMDVIHVGSGTQISYTGYVGDYTLTIRHVNRTARHAPGSVGPHTYRMRGWNYSAGTCHFNLSSQRSHDSVAYIHLTEIAV